MKRVAETMPTANIAINKSRVKMYDKKSDTPVFYLTKGQEFQIELFNPTKDNILAKIFLNNKVITQGGLVLRPGERVFLDRYIDVAKKFKFDTYEVSNTEEVRKAIEDNGDFKVEFYKEAQRLYNPILMNPTTWTYYDTTGGGLYGGDITTTTLGNSNIKSEANFTSNTAAGSSITLDGLGDVQVEASVSSVNSMPREKRRNPLRRLKNKTNKIETGRVEEGSTSNQKLTTVNMDFQTYPFHTLTYKLLPLSQKVNTTQEISVKRYCVECGTKQKPNFKFCPNCGTKA